MNVHVYMHTSVIYAVYARTCIYVILLLSFSLLYTYNINGWVCVKDAVHIETQFLMGFPVVPPEQKLSVCVCYVFVSVCVLYWKSNTDAVIIKKSKLGEVFDPSVSALYT